MNAPRGFTGEGGGAALIGVGFFVVAALVEGWLRGPGRVAMEPPVDRTAVRWFARSAVLFGVLWFVRAVAGLGGVFVVCGAILAIAVVAMLRGPRRQT